MKLDVTLGANIDATRDEAVKFEAAGYDGIWTGETSHEPFLRLLQVAEATEHVTIGTSIAIAFGRTPLLLAHAGHDLARYSKGRFVLGLGSQVKPHIERRFSMPWSRPAARMREYILALRTIWASWQEGTRLDFDGEFYTHTLMTPFFSPAAHDYGAPEVWLAGVGEKMTEVAGEVCEGFFIHPFTTPNYLEQVTLPALGRGRSKAGHEDLGAYSVAIQAFAAIGSTDEELQAAVRDTKQQIAFYASTPAYRPVLELHGYGDLQPELTQMTREGRWREMADAIDDSLLDLIAVVGEPESVGAGMAQRWGKVCTRLGFYLSRPVESTAIAATVDAFRAAL